MASNFRPYYPRVYPNRQTAESDDVQRGMAIGSAFGKDIQGLGTALAGGIQEQQQNQVANQLLAQYYPNQAGTTDPNADLSTDLPEDVSPDIGGTATPDVQGNFQGGAAELKMRQDAAKQALGIQSVQAEIAQRQAAAKLASTKAAGVTLGGGSSSRWLTGGGQQGGSQQGGGQSGRGGKQPAYQANSGDVQNDESTDNSSQIAADFDSTYGQKGLYGKYLANLPNLKPDDQGNYPLTDAKGNVIATVPGSDATIWQQRTNAARIKTGLTPIGPLGQGQNPTSTAAAGTVTNPVVAQSQLHVRSLPFGTVIYDPNTKTTYTKQKPTGQ